MIEMRIYKLFKYKRKQLSKITLILILLLSIFLANKGWLTKIYNEHIFKNLQEHDIEYIESTAENASDLFLKLSLAKGVVAVIEGSSINIDAVVGGELEVGDIVQPIYDGIDILWKIALLSTVSLKVQAILVNNTDLSLLRYSIMLTAALFMPIILFPCQLSYFLARIGKSIFILTSVIYLLLPLSIFVNSLGTEYINNKYRDEALSSLDKEIIKLDQVKEELFQLEKENVKKEKSFFTNGLKAKFNTLKNKFIKINNTLQSISKNVINNLPILVTVYIINTLLLPLSILYISYKILIFIILHEAISVKRNINL